MRDSLLAQGEDQELDEREIASAYQSRRSYGETVTPLEEDLKRKRNSELFRRRSGTGSDKASKVRTGEAIRLVGASGLVLLSGRQENSRGIDDK